MLMLDESAMILHSFDQCERTKNYCRKSPEPPAYLPSKGAAPHLIHHIKSIYK